MKLSLLPLALSALLPSLPLLLPGAATAQTGAAAAPTPPSLPPVITATPPPPPPALDLQPASPRPSRNAAPAPTPMPSAADVAASAPLPEPAPDPKKGILLNFQGAALSEVLNYLSAAAGFIVMQEVPVTGTVNVVSRQPVNAEEAVDLLNAILNEKGYVAIRNGRILKIISRQDAEKRDLPVVTGSNPEKIPRNDTMVTQILPVRYVEVAKLVDNLRPLLSAKATISSNDSSNAILLTDTQNNIHRIAEIIRALDTSISSISTIHVYSLRFADAKAMADVLTQLFAPTQTASNQGNNQGRGNFPGGGPPNFGGNFGGNRGRNAIGGGSLAPESEARQAASRVVAVADEQSNSVIVSAPEEYLATISEVITRLDTSISDITETRIFPLRYADATELANILTSLYSDLDTTANQTQNGGRGNQGQRGGQFQRPGQQAQPQGQQQSERALLQSRVVAVADPRTNAVIVSSSRDTMLQIATTIGRLDASDTKKQHVYVYQLGHADPDNVATILRGMFGVDTSSASASNQPSTSRLTNRTSSGATTDIANTLNTNGATGGTGR